MPFLHDGDKRLAFPFSVSTPEDHGMPSNAWVLSQDADLHLRGGVRARVTWPPATPVAPPPLLVFLPPRGEGADPHLCAELAVQLPAVVLTADSGSFRAAREALEWGADHAAELGADPHRILLVGEHRGATAVAALAREARDRGWPEIAHVVLIDSRSAVRVDAVARMLRATIAARGQISGSTRRGTPAASAPGSQARSA